MLLITYSINATIAALYLCNGWLLLLFVWVYNLRQQFFGHITTVSDCDRELNVHFYSATSLKCHGPDTWHYITPSYIILTLGRLVLALARKSECQGGAACNILNDFGLSRPGNETMTSRSPERCSILLACTKPFQCCHSPFLKKYIIVTLKRTFGCIRGVVVEWLECLAVVRKVAGSSPA